MCVESPGRHAGGMQITSHPSPSTAPSAGTHPQAGMHPSAGAPASYAAPAAAAPQTAERRLRPVLQARGLIKSYGDAATGTQALAGVDLNVAAGESLAVMGPSGCGKTTLLHVMAGILSPSSGSVLHADRDLASLSDAERTTLRRSAFGFVFQDGQLLPELTVLENVILPRMLGGTSRRAATAAARMWLDRLGIGDLADRRPGQISGGQAQRVAIARAIAGEPSVVFADEPTGALDQATGQAVLDVLIRACHDSGAALVMVTHDAQVAAACSRTIALRDGRIVQEFQRPTGAAR